MKKILAAFIATLAILLGGIAAATPAQAAWGSTADFGALVNAPLTARLITTKMNGTVVYQAYDQVVYDTYRTCPSQSNLHIRYTRNGLTYNLSNGSCLYTTLATYYYITLVG
jgi:hypothetical protein